MINKLLNKKVLGKISHIFGRTLTLLLVLLVFSQSALALSAEQMKIFNSGIYYFDVASCTPSDSSGPGSAAIGDLDRFLQALALIESGGRYTANNNNLSLAQGRYQILPGSFDSYANSYPPAQPSKPIASEPSLAGSKQDAMVYLNIYKAYERYDHDLLRTAASWIWPAAADSPNDPEMDHVLPGANGGNTPRTYATKVINAMGGTAASAITLAYRNAPDFDNLYETLDKDKNTPLGSFPGTTAGTTAATSSSGSKTVIVVDPGHAGVPGSPPADALIPNTYLNTHDYPNEPEQDDVYDVATILKTKLEAAGYAAILTKTSATDNSSLVAKANVANSNNADLALSIHYDSGFGQFGARGEIYTQDVGRYRGTGTAVGPNRLEFNDADVAAKSNEYAKKIKTARNKYEANHVIINEDWYAHGSLIPGDIPFVQLLSQVPWVYNEAGGPLNASTKEKYASGLFDGVKASIGPNEHKGSSQTTPNECDESGNGAVQGDIVRTAINWSWPTPGHGPNKSDAKLEYVAAVAKYASFYGSPEGGPNWPYAYCNLFVLTVMRAAADPNYEKVANQTGDNSTMQYDYMLNHPDMYEEIPNLHNTSNLKPGDILVNTQHVYLYLGDQGHSGYVAASASQNGHVPEATGVEIGLKNSTGDYHIMRFKG
jgi:N-acetylmuramoyl-L-alanine amidase